MSELVQVLWFEDVSFLNEQMLDTPLGRFSIRQMGIFLIFGFLAWITSLAFTDLTLKIIVAGATFFTGAAVFTRKIKTVSPEKHILCLINRFIRQVKQKYSATNQGKQSVEEQTKSTLLLLSATLGVPVKVVGVLKDFTGKILQSKNFKVSVNNTVYSNGETDEEGCFCTYFVPDCLGVFQIGIQPEDTKETIQQITIQVNPNKEEEPKHAKTKTETTS